MWKLAILLSDLRHNINVYLYNDAFTFSFHAMEKENAPLLVFKSIAGLLQRLELPGPTHPLVALINYASINVPLADAGARFSLDFYKISFKTGFNGRVKYGPGHYDFNNGGLAFLAPRQIVTMSGSEESYEGYSLFFHPDLLKGYQLGNSITSFGFFSYGVSEALYLSEKEKQALLLLFESIEKELGNNIDPFSQDILVTQIEQLLNYGNRFYHRQFITRRMIYNDLITRMNSYLSERFEKNEGLPTVQEVSVYLNLTPRYLTDMLKSLTGLTAQQHIHLQLIERAKQVLAHSHLTISEIAYQLGFEHPQSFSKFFRQKTNISPVAYRESLQ